MASIDDTSLSQHENPRVQELRRAIQENTRELTEVRQKRLRAEDEIVDCKRETERRWDLMMEKSEVADVLQQLGLLLQEARHLSEHLNGEASADRNDLKKRSQCFTDRVRSRTAEVLELKERLVEAKARNLAAQALILAPTSKSKRNKSKSK